MKEFFKWMLIILLAILMCPFLLILWTVVVAIFEFVIGLFIIAAPILIPICTVWAMIEYFDD